MLRKNVSKMVANPGNPGNLEILEILEILESLKIDFWIFLKDFTPPFGF